MEDYENQANSGSHSDGWESLSNTAGNFDKTQAAQAINEKLKEIGSQKPKSYEMESTVFSPKTKFP